MLYAERTLAPVAESDLLARLMACAPGDYPTYRLIPPAWYADARCRGKPLAWFFPPAGRLPHEAMAVCGDCPARRACLTDALEDSYSRGVWGGSSERQRKLARRRGLDAAALLAKLDTPRRRAG